MSKTNRYTFQNSDLNTKNIAFKSGSQNDLNTIISVGNAVEGVFYLTTDTHRLYIGREITENRTDTGHTNEHKIIPIPVNEGIQTVSEVSDLTNINANAGEFYYTTTDNILCIYNGSEWVQINPDTNNNDDTKVTSINFTDSQVINGTYAKATGTFDNSKDYYIWNGSDFSKVTGSNKNATNFNTFYEKTSNNGKSIVYTVTIGARDYDRISGNSQAANDVVTYFVLNSDDLITTSKTGIKSSLSGNTATVKLDGGVADSAKKITFTGAGNVSLSSPSNNNITITGSTYSLSRGTTTQDYSAIALSKDSTNVGTIQIITGDNLGIDTSDTTGITIQHTGPEAAVKDSGTDIIYGNNTDTTPSSGDSILIPTFKRDSNGHIRDVSDVQITLPTDANITSIGVNDTDPSKLELMAGSTPITGENKDLYFNVTLDNANNSSPVYNQGNLGHLYTAGHIDTLIANTLKGLNALIYKGTVGKDTSTISSTTLPTTDVSIGDVYLVDNNVSSLTYLASGSQSGAVASAHDVNTGDLLIAQSSTDEENSEGTIDSNNVRWTRIESGNDTDTTYSLARVSNSNEIQLIASTDSNSFVDSFAINGAASGPISVDCNTTTITGTTKHKYDFTLSHTTSGIITNDALSKVIGPTNATTSLDYGDSIVIPQITVNKYGHVTASDNKTYTLPASINYTLKNTTTSSGTDYSTTLRLFADNASAGAITLNGTNGVSVSPNNSTINISHDTITTTSSTASLSIPDTGNDANQFSAISAISTTNGHIDGFTTKTFTLYPYSLEGSSVTTTGNTKKFSTSLMQHNGAKGTISYQSNTLDISATTVTPQNSSYATTTYTVDLKWGTF